jgi:glyoxylase-like metal-dependent hydrolase (beta-lactamase superfamily II)
MATDYSIWGLAYTRSNMPRDFFGGTLINSNQGQVRNPMVFSALLGGRTGERPRPIVVDTGMKGSWSPSGKGYENVESPATVLAKVGIDAGAVETVILTHLHFDHAGNLDAFPNAVFHVQRAEFEGWRRVFAWEGPLGTDSRMWPLSSMSRADFDYFERLIGEGRVRFVDGDQEIAPGVNVRLARDSHTFGSQWVEVETGSGPHVVAGDCVYWYVNVERMWPPGYLQGNAWNLIETYREIRRLLKDEVNRIVPGHDPELFERHPSWIAGHNPVAEVHLAAGERSRRP